MATVDDALGRKKIARSIAVMLMDHRTEPPLTMSIEAEWGVGKSSFMRQLEAELATMTDAKGLLPLTVWFNPWMHEKSEAMWASFALNMEATLRKKAAWHTKLRRAVCDRIDWSKAWRDVMDWSVFGVFAAILGCIAFAALAAFKDAAFLTLLKKWVADAWREWNAVVGLLPLGVLIWLKSLKSPLEVNIAKYLRSDDRKSQLTYVEQFGRDFYDMVKGYADGRRVIVFVDDLDRCEVPAAVEMIRSINLLIGATSAMAGDKRAKVIFVLAIERHKVAAGIAMNHEKVLPYLHAWDVPEEVVVPPVNLSKQEMQVLQMAGKGMRFGYQFLEKFIQLPFRLPRANPVTIQRYINRLTGTEFHSRNEQRAITDAEDAMYTREALREISVYGESEMRAALTFLAPHLDYHPRRIKQALNLLRLYWFITASLRIDESAHEKPAANLTALKLAMIVAVELRWPACLETLAKLAEASDKAAGDEKAAGRFPANTPEEKEVRAMLETPLAEPLMLTDLRAFFSLTAPLSSMPEVADAGTAPCPIAE